MYFASVVFESNLSSVLVLMDLFPYFVMHLRLFIINEFTFLEMYQFSNKDSANGLSKVQRRWLLD